MYDALVIRGYTAMEDLRLNSTLSPTTSVTGTDIRDQAMTYMMYKVGKCNILYRSIL